MVATNKHVFFLDFFTLTFGEDEDDDDEPIFDEHISSDGLVQPPTRENWFVDSAKFAILEDGWKTIKKKRLLCPHGKGGSYQTKTILGLIIPLRNPT